MDGQVHEKGYAALEGDAPSHVKPGVYQLRFDYYATAVMFGRAPKLVLWFTIIEPGPYFDLMKLPRFYNVRKLIGRPAKFGRFKVGFKSTFLRDYARLFRVPARLDRIPMSEFGRRIIVGRVRTVTHGSNQLPIPEGLQYSVIEELLRCEQ
jgi:hypothetical protein